MSYSDRKNDKSYAIVFWVIYINFHFWSIVFGCSLRPVAVGL